MAKRNANKANKVQVAFEAISIEGGLLSPEWLSKIAQLQGEAQTPADYKIPKGLTLRDEIGRYWRIAEALWNDYRAKTEGLTDTTKATEDFVTTLLSQCLCFDDFKKSEKIVRGEHAYPISALASEGLVPIVISSPQESLDSLAQRFGEEHRKRTAFGLLQEYLNASDSALWGVVCDGDILRIVRDNASLTKPAWIEVDIKRIFQELRFADFAAFWLLSHRTRFGVSENLPDEAIIEKWKVSCRSAGTRARDQLRIGVEEAIEILGQGFISYKDNAHLRTNLQNGNIQTQDYFQELLRLVYRLIFLVTVEERDLLHPEQTSDETKSLYLSGYSLKRLRDRSVRRNTYDRFSDLWESLKIAFKGLGQGEPKLGLPALGGLFESAQTPILNELKIENGFLLQGIFKLCWLKIDSGISRVNWRDMGPEELGSVYECLLELVPQILEGGNRFTFLRGDDARGNTRKLTGSYYTPDELVQTLLDSALEPVVAATIKNYPQDPVKAILSLTVIDPACGSAHFLLGAARRLAVHIARLEANGTPTSKEYRHALRRVIGHCIYGVDRNPMALELARTALWLEAMTPDAPLNFLDHHLVCGDALIGLMDLEVLNDGVPSEAFSAQSGDDREICKELAKENKKKLKDIVRARELNSESPQLFDLSGYSLIPILKVIEEMPDNTPQEVVMKQIALENYNSVATNAGVTIAAEMYIAAFFAPKTQHTKNLIPTTDDILRAVRGVMPRIEVINFIKQVVKKEKFLHWKLKFAHVFEKGGFDVVLGNPPWEKINFKDEEYFAHKYPDIANAQNKAKRKELLERLSFESPVEYADYESAKRSQDAISFFCRFGGRYPWTGVSRINLYSVFCETGVQLLSNKGRLGFVLATGIVSDENNKVLLSSLIRGQRLIHNWDFENCDGIFPGVHRNYRFSLFCAGGKDTHQDLADFAFYLTKVGQLLEAERHFTLTKEEFLLLNPVSQTCPSFRNQREAEVSKFIYKSIPAHALHSDTTRWPGTPKTPFNMSNDSGLFVELSQRHIDDDSESGLVRLYESKFMHQFNHRFATFLTGEEEDAVDFQPQDLANPNRFVLSRYWLPRNILAERFPGKWFLAYRMIVHSTNNERTSVAAIIPEVGSGHSLSIIQGLDAVSAGVLCTVLNSFVFDFCARQKIAGLNFNHWIWNQLPMPTIEQLNSTPSWCGQAQSIKSWLFRRGLELTYTAFDLQSFAKEANYTGRPFAWNDERRFNLRCEIDAAMFHLYLPTNVDRGWASTNLVSNDNMADLIKAFPQPRDAVQYILDSFPTTKKKDERNWGEFRTKRIVLEIYDAMAESLRAGVAYESRLAILDVELGTNSNLTNQVRGN